MQPAGSNGNVSKPTPVLGNPTLADLLNAAAAQAASSGTPSLPPRQSAFSPIPPGQTFPPPLEVTLFSQLAQYYPQYQAAQQIAQHAALQQDHIQQQLQQQQQTSNTGRTRSVDSRASSAYQQRHQAAEQRRRTRINDRLDNLRKIVPHSERANTAAFLEEVYNYVEAMQKQVLELEQAQKAKLVQAIAKPFTAKPETLAELTTIPEGIGEGSRPKSVTPPPPASNGSVATPHGASSEESGQPCKRRRV